ncbi:MAG: hypothetical protein PHQ58_04700 [Rhodoferax sp.]|uniref:hypothetical protein n=1 Tax=Rhodoferax sp. TaxID=50421 RepID=UPI002603FCEB|nr:hypothetical protein [Rhodoferax sp.]MDD2879712.1 hypothetical protein [Rhodoferax sp.]
MSQSDSNNNIDPDIEAANQHREEQLRKFGHQIPPAQQMGHMSQNDFNRWMGGYRLPSMAQHQYPDSLQTQPEQLNTGKLVYVRERLAHAGVLSTQSKQSIVRFGESFRCAMIFKCVAEDEHCAYVQCVFQNNTVQDVPEKPVLVSKANMLLLPVGEEVIKALGLEVKDDKLPF